MTDENQSSRKVALRSSGAVKRTRDLEVLFTDDEGSAFYPHCILPPHFFDAVIAKGRIDRRELLSIQTWGGRDVMAIVSKSG